MIKEIADGLWLGNLITKDNKKEVPYADYISPTSYPEQNSELLNTWVTLNYRDHRKMNLEALDYDAEIIDPETGSLITSRPEDDDPNDIPRNHDGPEYQQIQEDLDIVYNDKFLVLRADNVEPFKMVAINADYSVVLVTSCRKNNMDHYEFLDDVTIYTYQKNDLMIYDSYEEKYKVVFDIKDPDYSSHSNAYPIRIDQDNSSETVYLAEPESGEENGRVYLGQEIRIHISNDYNPLDPTQDILDQDLYESRRKALLKTGFIQ